MTFDLLFDQPLDVWSHGYINRMLENPHGNSLVSFACTQHGGERKVCSPGKRENKPLAGLYRIFDVIKTIINLVRV
jgi:hypothetical protein